MFLLSLYLASCLAQSRRVQWQLCPFTVVRLFTLFQHNHKIYYIELDFLHNATMYLPKWFDQIIIWLDLIYVSLL